MTRLDLAPPTTRAGMILRTPPNWTAVLFFACLASLHLFIATASFLNQRWEAFMSVIFGVVFALASIACYLSRWELCLLPGERLMRIRAGLRRLHIERFVPFDQVKCVRLTLLDPGSPKSATIELVCAHEVIECPPTSVPRQEALCLAMTLNAHLVKVYGPAFGPASERLDSITSL